MGIIDPITDQVLLRFLEEDMGFFDITSDIVISKGEKARGYIISKSEGVLSGVKYASRLFKLLGADVRVLKFDGDKVVPDEKVIEVEGFAKSILLGERVALNLLMHLSGVATLTFQVVSELKKLGSNTRVAATRKTLPGMHFMEKKAVENGGGDTHRYRLDDCVLIKTNHLAIIGDVKKAVEKAKKSVSFVKKVEVEVENPEDALTAINAGADIVMLDNFPPEKIRETVELIRQKNLRDKVIIEASGNISLENISEFGKTGVDVISMGCITHSAPALDFSLKIEPV